MLQTLIPGGSHRPRSGNTTVDVQKLASELKAAIAGEVRFDDGSRALYATDASNYRQVPIGVVIPRSVEDVISTVKLCRKYDAPILPRGGGTSLCGQTCNVAVVIDFSKYMNRVLAIDRDARTALVEPGVVLDDLREAASKVGLTFAPDPATHDHNTLGGMIGNNSCGPHSVMGGMTEANVLELDVLTYDGLRITVGPTNEEARERVLADGGRHADILGQLQALQERYAARIHEVYPDIPRRVSGYNLRALLPEEGFNLARALVGSEGTCVIVLGARLRLLPNPPVRVMAVLGYEDVYRAADHVPQVMGFGPIALEGIDERLVSDMRAIHLNEAKLAALPPGEGWLVVEFGGDTHDEAHGKVERMLDQLAKTDTPPSSALYEDPAEQQKIWKIRESGLGATAHVPNKPITWEGWEDSAVPPEKLGQYLRELRKLLDRYGYEGDFYGHFGQGCLHTRINFDLETAPGIERFRHFLYEAAHLVVNMGGSISGEHGDGQSKAELLPIMFGEDLMQAFREFKRAWDPQGRMNPGKVIDAFDAGENLRLGSSYNPPEMPVFFHYTGDGGNFARASLRCVGVGECRKKAGTMCPSYKATHEEKHSTRGRARLLFEMLQGEVIRDGWNSQAVHEALDLCLSCKGCKGECPVSVDMATYKAEFMAHYYEQHRRPMPAWAFGLIDRWARWGSHLPGLANFVTASAPFAGLVKGVAGVAQERQVPRLAAQSFRQWFASRPQAEVGTDVILWPDTFNNYFHPEVARAAVNVLEQLGHRVRVPPRPLCCGRPLYEWGMLDRARAYLQQIMDSLAPDIEAGVPIVGLEPACVSVFREELPNLFPFNEQALRLGRQVQLLDEYLQRTTGRIVLPRLDRRALVHGHCHHKSVLGLEPELGLLRRLGLDMDVPDSGCCGMAGSFGFLKEKYAISQACGESVLLPRVRAAAGDALIISDGFSCREQIRQGGGRQALHLAQVLDMAFAHRE